MRPAPHWGGLFIFMSRVDKLIEGRVSDIAFGGEGILKSEGKVTFVPFVALDEQVRVRVFEEKKNFGRGRAEEILEKSPQRTDAPCPYYGNCGGCQYQHITYEEERRLKVEQLRQLLKRIGGIENAEIRPLIFGPDYGYRNRITVHQEDGKVGFRSFEGNHLIDIEECLLASPEVNRKLRHLRTKNHPRPHYSIRADAVMGEAFYQTNEPLMSQLQQVVSGAVSQSARAILELYCGVGFFTIKFIERGVPIIAVESDPKALEVARRTLPSHVKLLEGSAEEKGAEAIASIHEEPWSCLIDPPREGLSEIVRKDLLGSHASEILYLSCDPATLSRDLKALSGIYKADWFQPIDLFPRTAHLECLTHLTRI